MIEQYFKGVRIERLHTQRAYCCSAQRARPHSTNSKTYRSADRILGKSSLDKVVRARTSKSRSASWRCGPKVLLGKNKRIGAEFECVYGNGQSKNAHITPDTACQESRAALAGEVCTPRALSRAFVRDLNQIEDLDPELKDSLQARLKDLCQSVPHASPNYVRTCTLL